MWQIILQYVLPTALALPTAFVVARSALRKDEAAAVHSSAESLRIMVTETAEHVVIQLKERVTELEADMLKMKSHIEAVEHENKVLRHWASMLVAQVVEAGQTPVSLAEAERGTPHRPKRSQS